MDPSRHAPWYEAFAAEQGARIVRVLDTHVHADHVSGGPELARRLGVPYFVSAGAGFELRHPVTPLADGAADPAGRRARRLDRGARDPHARVTLPAPRRSWSTAAYLLTGDTLFVGERGAARPGRARRRVGPRPVLQPERPLRRPRRPRRACSPRTTRASPRSRPRAWSGAGSGTCGRRFPSCRSTTPDEFVRAVRGAVKDPPAAYAEIIRVNLGAPASEEQISEWELGKNQCAASSAQGGRGVESRHARVVAVTEGEPPWPSRSSTCAGRSARFPS